MTESFAPTIRGSNGIDYEPRGWEWVLSFAIKGCDWAVKEASKPEFRERIIEDLKETKREQLQAQIDRHLERIADLKEELRIL